MFWIDTFSDTVLNVELVVVGAGFYWVVMEVEDLFSGVQVRLFSVER